MQLIKLNIYNTQKSNNYNMHINKFSPTHKLTDCNCNKQSTDYIKRQLAQSVN